jgi:integrase
MKPQEVSFNTSRTRRRRIGQTVKVEGPAWALRVIVKDKFSTVPGTGTIGTVKINGVEYKRWRGFIENSKGVKQRIALYAPTLAALNRKIAEVRKPAASREGQKLLLETYLKSYFLPGIKTRVRSNTYECYSRAVTLHIVPHLGAAKLTGLQPKHVDAWLAELAEDEIGKRAAQQAFMVLKRAYNYALDLELCDRNPLQRLKAPKAPTREQRILDLEEVQKLLASAQGGPWFALFFTSIATSMRQGELLGLTWNDVQLDSGYLRVTKQLANTHDGLELTEPKTATSKRRIDLSPEAVAVLRSHRKAQMASGASNRHNLVFPNEVGGFVDRNDFAKRVFKPLLTKAELPDVTFHSLRHSGNSLLAQAGASLKVLQQRLGHSTASTTLSTYTHVAASDGQAAASTLGALLASGLNSGLNSGGGARVQKPRKQKRLTAKGVSMVGRPGIEPGTSCLSSMRSNQLS